MDQSGFTSNSEVPLNSEFNKLIGELNINSISDVSEINTSTFIEQNTTSIDNRMFDREPSRT